MGSEFYRDDSPSITSKTSFPFLQTLRFEEIDNWEKWLCCRCEFRRLQELCLIGCPKLTGKLLEELPSLKKLEIDGCWRLLVASLQVPAIRELEMVGFGELQLKMPASGFAALQTSHVENPHFSYARFGNRRLPFFQTVGQSWFSHRHIKSARNM